MKRRVKKKTVVVAREHVAKVPTHVYIVMCVDVDDGCVSAINAHNKEKDAKQEAKDLYAELNNHGEEECVYWVERVALPSHPVRYWRPTELAYWVETAR